MPRRRPDTFFLPPQCTAHEALEERVAVLESLVAEILPTYLPSPDPSAGPALMSVVAPARLERWKATAATRE